MRITTPIEGDAMDDLLERGLQELQRRADGGQTWAAAVLDELRRLGQQAVDAGRVHRLDTESSLYAQAMRNEVLR
jgi:hypothetical protein